MSRYIFSGGLTDKMAGYLKKIPEFEPMDVLVSQLDRASINKMIEYIDEGIVKSLFIDSGAYSEYTGKVDHLDVDEYIEYVNSIDQYIYAVAQVDKIPGKFGEPKKPKDYEESSELSWENYLYMRKRLKSPEKLIPVFHQREPFSALQRMVDYRDPDAHEHEILDSEVLGKVYTDRVNICGLSPMNDIHTNAKQTFLFECYDLIHRSSYPDIKTHLFGMTSLDLLSKLPYYSADSVSHRLRTAYNKVFTRKWGTISLSDASRTSRVKSNQSFLRTCDPKTYKEAEDLFKHYGFTVDEMRNDNCARVCVDICEVQKAIKNEYAYHPSNRKISKKLFEI